MSAFDPIADRPVTDPSASPPLLVVSGTPQLWYTVGASDAYSFQPTVSGGTGPYTWTASGLPPGLSIDASTGLVSGRPTTGGIYLANIRATDSLGVVGDLVPQPQIQTVVHSQNPASLLTHSNIGPYTVHLRNPFGYGVPVGTGPLRVSWFGAEVLHIGSSQARLSWFGAEVLRSIADKSSPRPVPPKHILMPPDDTDWFRYVNQRRRGGAPRAKRPVQYTVV